MTNAATGHFQAVNKAISMRSWYLTEKALGNFENYLMSQQGMNPAVGPITKQEIVTSLHRVNRSVATFDEVVDLVGAVFVDIIRERDQARERFETK